MSDWGNFLTLGCTALVLKMLDDGVNVGAALQPLDPVAALRMLDKDFSWTQPIPLACGDERNGIEIQEHYLRCAEAYIQRKPAAWAKRVVKLWREAIERLKQGPAQLAQMLDPYIKMRVFGRLLVEQGFSFKQFSSWSRVISSILPQLKGAEPPRRGIKEFLRERMPTITFSLLEDRVSKSRLDWRDYVRAAELYQRLRVLDLNYHDIGAAGLYWRLRQRGAVNSRLVTDMEIAFARNNPPSGTRARLRAEGIKALCSDSNAFATWERVESKEQVMILDDPLVATGSLKAKTAQKK